MADREAPIFNPGNLCDNNEDRTWEPSSPGPLTTITYAWLTDGAYPEITKTIDAFVDSTPHLTDVYNLDKLEDLVCELLVGIPRGQDAPSLMARDLIRYALMGVSWSWIANRLNRRKNRTLLPG